MQYRAHLSTILLILACTAGCTSSVGYLPTGNPELAREPRPPEKVEVFTIGAPSRPFVELGIFETQESEASVLDTPSAQIQDMRARAGELGCDGLVITGANDSVVTTTKDDKSKVTTLKGFRGTCIVFTDEPVRAGGDAAPGYEPQDGDRLCIPNETLICHGPGACHGGQSCLPDGSGYTACDCGPHSATHPSGNDARP